MFSCIIKYGLRNLQTIKGQWQILCRNILDTDDIISYSFWDVKTKRIEYRSINMDEFIHNWFACSSADYYEPRLALLAMVELLQVEEIKAIVFYRMQFDGIEDNAYKEYLLSLVISPYLWLRSVCMLLN